MCSGVSLIVGFWFGAGLGIKDICIQCDGFNARWTEVDCLNAW